MTKMRLKILVLGVLFLFPWGTIGRAADFPQRPVRMIIPYSAGGGNDVLCRAFQPSFEKVLGQKMLVENMPAGSGKVATMELMKAKPDGYTLVLSTTEAWVGYYYAKVYDYKPWEQMVPIGNVASEPYGFVEVRAESPFKTWADLAKAAKENPGKLSCGGPAAGGITELVMNEINKGAGIKTRYVPFAGAGPSRVALLGGHIDFRLCQPSEAIAMIRAGQSRGLAVSSDKRMEALPDVPTFKELGWETIMMTRSIWGSPKLPGNRVNSLTKMIEKATKDPAFIKIAQDQLLCTVDYQPPEKMKAGMQNFDKVYGPKMMEMYK